MSALRILVPVGIVGGLLAAFWLLPFGADIHYSSSMGYNRILGAWSNLIPDKWPAWILDPLVAMAILGTIIAFARRDRVAAVLAVSTAGSGFASRLTVGRHLQRALAAVLVPLRHARRRLRRG